MYSGNTAVLNSLRIEIAVLQETVYAFSQKMAKFRIPVIMNNDTISTVLTTNANITNKRNGNISPSQLNMDNTIDLILPFEYTFTYGEETIPVGTRFLVAFVGANVNDAKIIGRYDQSSSDLSKTLLKYMINFLELGKREKGIKDEFNIALKNLKASMDEYYSKTCTDISRNYYNTLDLKITDIYNNLESTIAQLKTTLESSINHSKETCDANLNQAKEEFNQSITAVKSEFTTGIDTTKTDLEERIEETKTDILKAVSASKDECDDKINTINEELNESISTNKSEILELISRLQKSIEDNSLSDEEDTENVAQQISGILLDITKLYQLSEETIESITSTKTYLLAEVTRLTETLKSYSDNQIAIAKSNLTNSFIAADDVTKQMINNKADAIVSTVTELDNKVNEAINSMSSADEILRTDFTSADTELSMAINDVNVSLTNKITTAKTNTDKAVSDLKAYTDGQILIVKRETSSAVSELNNNFNETVKNLSNDINEVSHSINTKIEDTVDNINSIISSLEESLTGTLTASENKLNKKIDDANKETESRLVAQINKSYSEAKAYTDNVNAVLTDMISACSTNSQSGIDLLRADLVSEVATMKTLISTKISTLEEVINGKISDLKSSTEEKINELSQSTKTNYSNFYKEFKDAIKDIEDHEEEQQNMIDSIFERLNALDGGGN